MSYFKSDQNNSLSAIQKKHANYCINHDNDNCDEVGDSEKKQNSLSDTIDSHLSSPEKTLCFQSQSDNQSEPHFCLDYYQLGFCMKASNCNFQHDQPKCKKQKYKSKILDNFPQIMILISSKRIFSFLQ